MKINWNEFKNIYDSRELDITMIETSTEYKLIMGDYGVEFICNLGKDEDGISEFETSYKNLCNNKKVYKVSPLPPLSLHCMEPWGCVGDSFEPRGSTKYVCAITLSDPSQDGLTFTYNSDIEIEPTVGNYVFQKNGCRKSWATSVDTVNHTITFEYPLLSVGAGVYSVGMYVDALVPNWASLMYVWGLTATILEYEDGVLETEACTDLAECSVVDLNDMWLMDEVCQAAFGVDADEAEPYLIANKWEFNGEYGHWTKYYDETWIANCNNTYIAATDNAPGTMFPGLVLRFSLFTSEVEVTKRYDILLDYKPTSIPEGSL